MSPFLFYFLLLDLLIFCFVRLFHNYDDGFNQELLQQKLHVQYYREDVRPYVPIGVV